MKLATEGLLRLRLLVVPHTQTKLIHAFLYASSSKHSLSFAEKKALITQIGQDLGVTKVKFPLCFEMLGLKLV